MATTVELHILQNFVPSNLNRDDTGSPKDCEFGGYHRARISSQCLKRAVRETFKVDGLLPAEARSTRTKRLHGELVKRLVDAGREPAAAEGVATAALAAAGFKLDEKSQTQYLLFVGEREIDRLVELCRQHWDSLATAAPVEAAAGATGRAAKRQARESVDSKATAAIREALDGGRATDLALFGRMLADTPDKNVDAASQVAHAISTHQVSAEFDFYTAVDDLNTEEDTGAGMLGTVEFNSACYYRYANIDVEQLARNLGGDLELARVGVEAFLRASVAAVPSGKKNSMAQQNPPSFIFAVVRDRGQWSLANAFVQPVRPRGESDLVAGSVKALDAYWAQLVKLYGDRGIRQTAVAALSDAGLGELAGARVDTFEALVQATVGAL